MNYSIIKYVLGLCITTVSALMIFPAIVGAVYMEKSAVVFLICAVSFFIIGRLLSHKKPANKTFYAREGFISVALSWIVISVISAVPFVVSGAIPNAIDALFETVSGFTTTGSSILSDVEALPKCMLFWRSFSHWLGGMGVLVFVLAILPSADGQNMYFMRAESPGPDVGKLVPNLRKTALLLYLIYAGMTVLQFVLLMVGRMPVFDALCLTFGTAGTGGFAILNSGLSTYSTYSLWVITVFMVLFGVNFNLYFFVIRKRFKEAFSIAEVRTYFIVYFLATAFIAVQLYVTLGKVSILDVAFQTASVLTTTGYSTVDFNLWPVFSKIIMVLLMFSGACAGSTGGGIKVSRFMICGKMAKREIDKAVHPRHVKVLKMDGKPIDDDVVHSTVAYMIVYVAIYVVSLLIVSFDCESFETGFTSIVATLNNIGPGLGDVGPTGNFANFSVLSKCVFIFDMLAGRLELFPILLLFTPSAWKN